MKKFITRYLFKAVTFLHYSHLQLMDWLYANGLTIKFSKCGNNVHIYYPCYLTGFEFIEIGNNVHINRGAFIRAEGGLKIGDNVHIGCNLVIYTINHNYKGDALPYDHTLIRKPVVIGKNVWIGINVTIIPGITIGEGAIIGAGATISKDVPPLAIVGSIPFRVIKFREESHYMNLEKMGHYGGVSGKLYCEED